MRNVEKLISGDVISIHNKTFAKNGCLLILINGRLYGKRDMIDYGGMSILKDEVNWKVTDHIDLKLKQDEDRKVLAKSKYGLEYRDGDIIETYGTVNGFDKFIIMQSDNNEGYKVRYYDKYKSDRLGREYEYSQSELLDLDVEEYIENEERNQKVGIYYPLYQ